MKHYQSQQQTKQLFVAKLFFLCVFILLHLPSFCQDTSITVYFKSGQSNLNASQQKFIRQLNDKPLKKITIQGYADTVGNSFSNKKLSQKRAQIAADAITCADKTITGMGESKEQKISLHKMRKAELCVWFEKPAIDKPIEIQKAALTFIDTCLGDTTLIMESGTMIKMNKCYYQKIKHCFSFKEYRNAVAVQQAGLRTVDERGNAIESGGMIDIKFCSDSCIKTPVIVFLPVPQCLSKQPMTLWTITRNNAWRNSRNKIEIVKINGKEFYKMEVYCPGRLNCDRPKGKVKKMKIKLKNGLKIESATISYNCPVYSINGKIKKRKNIVKFPYNCPNDEPLLHLIAKDKKGNTLTIDNKYLNSYNKKRKLMSKCNCNEKPKVKYLGIFKIRQKYLYKKYTIHKVDFKLSEK